MEEREPANGEASELQNGSEPASDVATVATEEETGVGSVVDPNQDPSSVTADRDLSTANANQDPSTLNSDQDPSTMNSYQEQSTVNPGLSNGEGSRTFTMRELLNELKEGEKGSVEGGSTGANRASDAAIGGSRTDAGSSSKLVIVC